MRTADTVRIRLDEPARAALTQMMAILSGDGEHLSLIPSKVVSFIIRDYAARYFARDKGRLVEGLLDRKALLKAMLGEVRDGSDAEIESLRLRLASLSPKRGALQSAKKTVPLPNGEEFGGKT